jgi:hypothetical protein
MRKSSPLCTMVADTSVVLCATYVCPCCFPPVLYAGIGILLCQAVFLIRDIVRRIRILGSVY